MPAYACCDATAEPRAANPPPRLPDAFLKSRIVWRQMRNQRCLMSLGAPCEKRGDGRDADAAAGVAHQIEDARGVAHLLVTEGAERHRRQRYEDKSHRKAADDVRPNDAAN